jgi:hypothetical protein
MDSLIPNQASWKGGGASLSLGVLMLDTERAYFERSRADLEARFSGRFVVIKGEEVIGGYNTIQEALAEGIRLFGLDNFLVRQMGVPTKEVSIPALTLGILRANPTSPSNG